MYGDDKHYVISVVFWSSEFHRHHQHGSFPSLHAYCLVFSCYCTDVIFEILVSRHTRPQRVPTACCAPAIRPGRWLGKGIRAGSREGYNLFSPTTPPSPVLEAKSVALPSDTQRERSFRFSQFSDSVFDRGVSSRLDYARAGKNGPLFGGMRDEVSPWKNGRLPPSWSFLENARPVRDNTAAVEGDVLKSVFFFVLERGRLCVLVLESGRFCFFTTNAYGSTKFV